MLIGRSCYLSNKKPISGGCKFGHYSATIQISHTLNPKGTYFLDSLDIFLENATVKLYENNTFLQQIVYSGDNGFYKNNDLNLKMDVDFEEKSYLKNWIVQVCAKLCKLVQICANFM